MKLLQKTYGKDQVRVMRVDRQDDRHEVRELTVRAMVTGHFDRAFTHADNSTSVATNGEERRQRGRAGKYRAEYRILLRRSGREAVGQLFRGGDSDGYRTRNQMDAPIGGRDAHPHSFVLDNNGKPFAKVVATRKQRDCGVRSVWLHVPEVDRVGWENYIQDKYTTIPETHDRMIQLPWMPPGGGAGLRQTTILPMREF